MVTSRVRRPPRPILTPSLLTVDEDTPLVAWPFPSRLQEVSARKQDFECTACGKSLTTPPSVFAAWGSTHIYKCQCCDSRYAIKRGKVMRIA